MRRLISVVSGASVAGLREVYRNKPVVRNDAGNVAKGLDKERPPSYVLGPRPVMETQFSGPSYVPCEVCLGSCPCICFYLVVIQDLALSSIQLLFTCKTWAVDGKPWAKSKVFRPSDPGWALGNVVCADSPQGEELRCLFQEVVLSETPNPKAGKWLSNWVKAFRGIQVRALRLELGSLDHRWGHSEHGLQPGGILWAIGTWAAEAMALTTGREVTVRLRSWLDLYTTHIHFSRKFSSFPPSWNLLLPPWWCRAFYLCF